MILIKFSSNDSFELLLRRFKRLYEKSGILSDIKKHRFYEKPSIVRKKLKESAIRRLRKKMLSKLNNY